MLPLSSGFRRARIKETGEDKGAGGRREGGCVSLRVSADTRESFVDVSFSRDLARWLILVWKVNAHSLQHNNTTLVASRASATLPDDLLGYRMPFHVNDGVADAGPRSSRPTNQSGSSSSDISVSTGKTAILEK